MFLKGGGLFCLSHSHISTQKLHVSSLELQATRILRKHKTKIDLKCKGANYTHLMMAVILIRNDFVSSLVFAKR
jgi:hypothetical protein